jgi:hypothetical protein
VALAGVGAGANVSRRSGDWQREDYDVFDVGLVPEVGRIYRINAPTEAWWWGVSFELTGRKSYGIAATLDEAKAAFKAEYVKWKAANGPGPERYVISVDGTVRERHYGRKTAIEATKVLKAHSPNSRVVVRDLLTGAEIDPQKP